MYVYYFPSRRRDILLIIYILYLFVGTYLITNNDASIMIFGKLRFILNYLNTLNYLIMMVIKLRLMYFF